MDFVRARTVADAVLYEGYLLYPYRRSSGKNRVRWQFGVLAPRRWIEARGPVVDTVAGSRESWWNQTATLLEAPPQATVQVRIRFLQVQRREVRGGAEAPFDEAVPLEFDLEATLEELLQAERTVDLNAPAAEDTEVSGTGQHLVHRREAVHGRAIVRAEIAEAPFPVARIVVRVENRAEIADVDAPRDQALLRAMVSTHVLLGCAAGSFLSLIDPPEWAAAAAQQCRNVGTFPVLAAEEGVHDLVLSSPIIMYDHPRVAPESPGDLFDATEIDEILSLRTLTLTDDEKAEVRATDPRGAELLNRVDTMPPEILERLHGAIRSLRPLDPGSHDPDYVLVAGTRVGKGSVVRLRPRGTGTDAHDMFLAGRLAKVADILHDVDGSRHIAVTVIGDPAADLLEWYGRYFHFSPDEVAPVSELEAT